MGTVIDILEERISAAMAAVTGEKHCAAMVKPATDPKFGDYQVNGVMPLAKKIKTNPRKFAEEIKAKLNLDDICEEPEIAGPGFINLRLKPDFVAKALFEINTDPAHLGIEKTAHPKTIVVDFSGPNIAKQMHVGHLRSTIIGDCICRLLEFEGHKVIRQNHIGDWGTQFGMLIQQVFEGRMAAAFEGVTDHKVYTEGNFSVSDTEELYKKAKIRDDTEPQFAQEARQWVVKLQQGNADAISFWKSIVRASLAECQEIYDRLSVKLAKDNAQGESAYKDDLPNVVAELKKKKLAVESEGAVCVFPPGFKDKDGKPLPVIIQKSDGAFLYATTDLAAIRYRVNELKADKIIYVTDSRQKLHFEMVFTVARMAGWVKDNVDLVHVTFGSVLGENGQPLKTRSGENVKLKELLDEAVQRARKVVDEKSPEFADDKKDKIAKAVGIGAVKYADFSNNRTSDYIFSFNKMLAMEGNTAPYMQYAYARVKSIGRKAQERGIDDQAELRGIKKINLTDPAELDLAKHLIRYGEAVEAAIADYRPNYLTAYLYELAQKFSVFYTNCPVLDAEPDKRPTRLLLCDLTAGIIKHGLKSLLGIDVIEQM
jgi:arginyl-tRNA synthetase